MSYREAHQKMVHHEHCDDELHHVHSGSTLSVTLDVKRLSLAMHAGRTPCETCEGNGVSSCVAETL